jgi:hypothetical protein
VFHKVFHKAFTMCFIRCIQEVVAVCLQEICAGGWYRALQQCVHNTSTSVFVCSASTGRSIHFAKLVRNLYKCFWKVFTTLVHVFLKGVHSSCTGVFWKAFTIYVHEYWKVFTAAVQVFFLKGFHSICTGALCTASTQFVQVFLQGFTAVAHRFWTLLQHACKCFARLLGHSYKCLLQGFYSSCKSCFERLLRHVHMCFWRLLQQLYRCSLTGFYSSCTSVCEGLLQHLHTCFWSVFASFVQALPARLPQQLYKCCLRGFSQHLHKCFVTRRLPIFKVCLCNKRSFCNCWVTLA